MTQPKQQISLAIPTWNRFEMVMRAVKQVLEDPRIGEIVICDDVSTDGSDKKLAEWAEKQSSVRLFKNPRNLDCYGNKAQTLRHCRAERVILFDSDNIMTRDYLDQIWGIEEWDPKTSYLPVFAKPHFDYREFAGQTISAQNVRQFMSNPNFRCALNTANYFVHRETYLGVWNPNVNPHTADSIYMNYRLLASGNLLHFVPGLEYDHEIHAQSHYKLNCRKTGSFAVDTEKKLRALS